VHIRFVDSTRTMDALSCVSTTFCVAVDTSGYAVIYNGSTWGTPSDIDSTRSVDAVSCVSSTFCVAVGASGYDAIYTGSWATATDIDSTRTMDAVVCTSTTFCVTGDTTGYSAKYTGTWATATDIDSSRSIKKIVCESTTFCVTGDTTGYSATYTGSWATATDVDNSSALESLTCASTTFCVASDSAGNVLTYNGTAWSYPIGVDASRASAAVSCPTSTFCADVDTSGYTTTYAPVPAPPPAASQLTWDTEGSIANILSDGADDYVYGPAGTPVEAIALSTSTPTYLTFTPGAQTWVATNEAGDLVSFWGYDAFGTLAFGTAATPFGFAGQYTDSTTGFSNLRARFYNAPTGGFTTRDPAFAVTDTAYTYAEDDPVNASDPSGLDCGVASIFCASYDASAGLVKGAYHHIGVILEVTAAGICVVSTVGVCFVAVAGAVAANIYQQWQSGDLTAANVTGTILLGATDVLSAGIGGVAEEIAAGATEGFTDTVLYKGVSYTLRVLSVAPSVVVDIAKSSPEGAPCR
jgi:RHS repeat-associated protein